MGIQNGAVAIWVLEYAWMYDVYTYTHAYTVSWMQNEESCASAISPKKMPFTEEKLRVKRDPIGDHSETQPQPDR